MPSRYWDDEISEGAVVTMEELGDFCPTANKDAREIKGYREEYYEGYSMYYNSTELREMAEHLKEVADWLDKRAESQ